MNDQAAGLIAAIAILWWSAFCVELGYRAGKRKAPSPKKEGE